MEAIRVASNVAASAASGAANAAASSTQTTRNTSTGSPLMNAVTYLMYFQALLILLLTIPVHVPYRAQFMKWLHYSPSLWRLRVVLFCINAFVGALLADTWLRLSHITSQIEAVQSAPNGVPAVPYGGAAGAAGAAGGPVDVTANSNALHELYSASFRGQRDFYLLSFTLFCSAVLFQLHLMLMDIGRERDAAEELSAKSQSLKQSVSESASATVAQMQAAASNVATNLNEKVSNVISSQQAPGSKVSARQSYKAEN